MYHCLYIMSHGCVWTITLSPHLEIVHICVSALLLHLASRDFEIMRHFCCPYNSNLMRIKSRSLSQRSGTYFVIKKCNITNIGVLVLCGHGPLCNFFMYDGMFKYVYYYFYCYNYFLRIKSWSFSQRSRALLICILRQCFPYNSQVPTSVRL